MAKLGGISLADSEGNLASGAAFLLGGPSKVSETVDICGIGEISVLAGSPYLVARQPSEAPDQVYSRGFELAQKGLDVLSVTGKADLALRQFSDEHILWWQTEQGQVLRVTSTCTSTATVPPVTLTLTDKSGKAIPSPPPPRHQHHEAFRYYRLSQVTDDLQDAMRNGYLALELLLSERYPKGKGTDDRWLRTSLSDLTQDRQFPKASNKPPDEFVDHFMKDIYKAARLPLFHAKIDKDHYVPQAVGDERLALSCALNEVTTLVLWMFENWHSMRRGSGWVSPKWVYGNMEKLFNGARMVVSRHDALDRAEGDLSHPRFKNAVATETRVIPHRSANEGPLIVAELNRVALANARIVRLFELVNSEAPLLALLLDAELETDGIDHLECQFRTRLANAGQPKRLFES